MGTEWRFAGVIVTAVLLSLGACNDRGQSRSTSGDIGGQPADTGTMGSPAAAGETPGELTDANIVALLDEANQADSAGGAYALTKAASPDVKAFAKLMMGDHHMLRLGGQQLAKKLNLTPQPPADDPLKSAVASEMAALKAAPKGQAFDRVYIEQEIGMHKAVLDLAEKGHDQADNEELKKLIEQARPVIEKHLEQAQSIQTKLGKPSA